MIIAVVGLGALGRALSTVLAGSGAQLVLAARDQARAESLSAELDGDVRALPIREAIAAAEVVVPAVPFAAVEDVLTEYADLLPGKVVVDPVNALTVDQGKLTRMLPEGRTAGSVVAGLLPPEARYVKALGTTTAGQLRSGAHRTPDRAVLFYATDDDQAAETISTLITTAGFTPLRAGGPEAVERLEMFGDLHTLSGFEGRLITSDEAHAALSAR